MIPIKTNNVRITSYYGNREYKYQGKLIKDFHHGIDIVPKPCKANEEIIAFEDGEVYSLQKHGKQYGTGCFVRIKHDKGLYTLYYHLKDNSICVNVGDKVKKGQKIGIIGTTGKSTGIHLHFQIDKGNNKTSINPYDYVFNNKELIEKTGLDKYTDEQLANMVWHGYFGNGEERKKKLGNRYNEVQKQVNLNIKNKTTSWNNIKIY